MVDSHDQKSQSPEMHHKRTVFSAHYAASKVRHNMGRRTIRLGWKSRQNVCICACLREYDP